jgi:Ser/Thr protein kinase RdoA (MazF antagonist)
LPGQTIPWEGYTRQHIKLLGAMLSNLHAELTALPLVGYPAVAEQYLKYCQSMQLYFTDPGVKASLNRKLGLNLNPAIFEQAKQLLSASNELKQQQVLHMDFVRSNILFTATKRRHQPTDLLISGVLDFEKTAYGHPLFDIARTLAFLLVDCKYKTATQVRKYFLLSGYQKRGTSQLPHVRIHGAKRNDDLLENLIGQFLMYDFYKFLKHNPYEDLINNDHFLRTCNQLLTRQLIYGNDTIKQS